MQLAPYARVLVLPLVAGLWSGDALAQRHWVGVGPYGGVVRSVAIDPTDANFMYAGSDGGLFMSRDGGDSWTAVPEVRSRTGAVAVDPSSPSTVFAITERPWRNVLFRTRDRGETWEPVGSGITCLQAVPDVFVSDFSKMLVRAGSPSTVFVATCTGVFRSTDDGESWSLGSMGIPEMAAPAAFAGGFDPTGRLYLGTTPSFGVRFPGPGILVSDDDGQSWSFSNEGLPDFPEVNTIAVDPLNPMNVYVGVLTRPPAGLSMAQGVFKSSDAGATWSATGLTSTSIRNIAIDTSDPPRILASATGQPMYRSADDGVTWDMLERPGTLHDLVADPFEPQRFYYGNRDGLFRSDDAAEVWQTRHEGIGAIQMDRVFFHEKLPGTRFARDNTTWFRSDLMGVWGRVRSGTILAIDPSDPSVMYGSSTAGFGGLTATALERSDDGGATWVARVEGLPATPSVNPLSAIVAPLSLAIDPDDPERLVLALQIIDVSIESAELRIFTSDDGGAQWTPASRPPDFRPGLFFEATVVMDPSDPAKVYLFCEFRGLFRSTDYGDTWAQLDEPALVRMHSLAIAPNENGSSRLYAATEDGVYGSEDNGQTWRALLSDSSAPGRLIVVDDEAPSKLYVSDADGGLLATADGGDTWCSVEAETLPSAARHLAIDSTQVRQICAATEDSSVLCLDLPRLGGDCNADGIVRVAELVLVVRISLGQSQLSSCSGVDVDGDGEVSIAELIAAVGNALDPSRACGA